MANYTADEAQEAWLRQRLQEAVDHFAGGSADKMGRLLGYTNGGFLREILGAKQKPVGKAIIERMKAVPGADGWFTKPTTASIVSEPLASYLGASSGLTPVAQRMSDLSPIVAPRFVVWEDLVTQRFDCAFGMEIRGHALGEKHPAGHIGWFVPGATPEDGDAVLIKAADNVFHLRYYESGIGGDWSGSSKVAGYRTIGRSEGAELIAVMASSMRKNLFTLG